MMSASTRAAAGPETDPTPLEHAFLAFREAGLRLPPVPHGMVAALRRADPDRYATADAPDLDAVEAWREAARAGALPPHVAFGGGGHGAVSWFIHYSLADGPVCVYLRHAFGNAFTPGAMERLRLNSALVGIEELVVRADEARAAGRLAPDDRLIVVEDAKSAVSGWQVAGPSATPWRPTRQAVSDALAWLIDRA